MCSYIIELCPARPSGYVGVNGGCVPPVLNPNMRKLESHALLAIVCVASNPQALLGAKRVQPMHPVQVHVMSRLCDYVLGQIPPGAVPLRQYSIHRTQE